MKNAAVPLLLLAAFFLPGCQTTARDPAPAARKTAAVYTRSPDLIVGHILAVDQARGTAIVDLMPDAPPLALIARTELVARTRTLHPTARLTVTRYRRGSTLAAKIVAGEPAMDDEVVWRSP
jgi:hypothetical protein